MTVVNPKTFKRTTYVIISVIALAVTVVGGARMFAVAATAVQPLNAAASSESAVPNEPANDPESKVRVDRSMHSQVGKASFYADRYGGRTMADGTPMNLYSNNAASLTLPLGTVARVVNLQTGKSALVTIRDRGPYVKGRIVDLSPATAKLIGMSNAQGLALVKVTPVSFPESRAASRSRSTDGRFASLN